MLSLLEVFNVLNRISSCLPSHPARASPVSHCSRVIASVSTASRPPMTLMMSRALSKRSAAQPRKVRHIIACSGSISSSDNSPDLSVSKLLKTSLIVCACWPASRLKKFNALMPRANSVYVTCSSWSASKCLIHARREEPSLASKKTLTCCATLHASSTERELLLLLLLLLFPVMDTDRSCLTDSRIFRKASTSLCSLLCFLPPCSSSPESLLTFERVRRSSRRRSLTHRVSSPSMLRRTPLQRSSSASQKNGNGLTPNPCARRRPRPCWLELTYA
mmetsp:Transcript_58503/g.136710  ORF Transcript_58503/g.136710 Transcript_58503/m.136710 type:complete len:276 (-) Transcript_58503:7-834(-)